MNSKVPLDIFIPPTPEFSYINMLVTNDRHGLNNGCFLIRINPWSVKLLSSVIAFHTFKPDVKLQYSEQSALEEMIEDVRFKPIPTLLAYFDHVVAILEEGSSPCTPVLV